MIDQFPVGGVLEVLGTYLMHSTLLLGLAWLVADRIADLRAREWVWRAALLGGLATTGLQLGLGVHPLAGQLTWAPEPELPVAVAEEQTSPLIAPAASPVDAARTSAFEASATPAAATRAALFQNRAQRINDREVQLEAQQPATVAAPMAAQPGSQVRLTGQPAEQPAAPPIAWRPLVLGAWMFGALVVAASFLLALARLRLHLAGRYRVTGGPLVRHLKTLSPRFPVAARTRLFYSDRLLAPIAHGLLHPTITVPVRTTSDLPAEEQLAMLAHELGHLERRDPAWLTVARLLGIGLFFQPLNRLAHRRLGSLAEFQCDAAALRATGDRVALARCLTEVAGWVVASRRPLPACGMADSTSPLAARVVRILEADKDTAPRAPLGTGAVLAACVAGVAWAAPGIAAPAIEAGAAASTRPTIEESARAEPSNAEERREAHTALGTARRPDRQRRLDSVSRAAQAPSRNGPSSTARRTAAAPAALPNPRSARLQALDHGLSLLVQERDALLFDLAATMAELNTLQAPSGLTAKASVISSQATQLVVETQRLKSLVAELRARSATAARVPQGK